MNNPKKDPLHFISISRNAETAILLILDLSRHFGESFIHNRDIARRKKIPAKRIRHIASVLESSSYIAKSEDFKAYRLIKSPDEISLGEIISVIDGAFSPLESLQCYIYGENSGGNQKLKKFLEGMLDLMMSRFESTTFKSLI